MSGPRLFRIGPEHVFAHGAPRVPVLRLDDEGVALVWPTAPGGASLAWHHVASLLVKPLPDRSGRTYVRFVPTEPEVVRVEETWAAGHVLDGSLVWVVPASADAEVDAVVAEVGRRRPALHVVDGRDDQHPVGRRWGVLRQPLDRLRTTPDSLRLRRLIPTAMRRRFGVGVLALGFLIGLVLVTAHALSTPAVAVDLGLAAVVLVPTAVVGLTPFVLLRLRSPYSLDIDREAVRTARGAGARTVSDSLPWGECVGVEVRVGTAGDAPDVRLLALRFTTREHVGDPSYESHRLVLRSGPGEVDLVSRVVAWLRETRPDLPVTVTSEARRLGVHEPRPATRRYLEVLVVGDPDDAEPARHLTSLGDAVASYPLPPGPWPAGPGATGLQTELDGYDAVVWCVGPDVDPAVLLRLTRDAGVPRVVVVTVGRQGPAPDAVVRSSGLEWTMVRVPSLVATDDDGQLTITQDGTLAGPTVGRDDVARLVAECLHDPLMTHRCYGVSRWPSSAPAREPGAGVGA